RSGSTRRRSPTSKGPRTSSGSASRELLELFRDVEQIGDRPEVRDLEDRGLGVGVDGDDRSARLHAGEVLNRPRDAEGEVDLGLDGLPGLSDLTRIRHPAGVNERTRNREHCAK